MVHVENEAIQSYRLGMMFSETSLIKNDRLVLGINGISLFQKAEKVSVKYQRTT